MIFLFVSLKLYVQPIYIAVEAMQIIFSNILSKQGRLIFDWNSTEHLGQTDNSKTALVPKGEILVDHQSFNVFTIQMLPLHLPVLSGEHTLVITVPTEAVADDYKLCPVFGVHFPLPIKDLKYIFNYLTYFSKWETKFCESCSHPQY